MESISFYQLQLQVMKTIAYIIHWYAVVTSFYFRANVESSYGPQVVQRRMQYTQKDKELIKKFVEARSYSLKSETFERKLEELEVESMLGKHIC